MQKSKVKNLEWEEAPEIKEDIKEILSILDLPHIDISRIFCFRTTGSKSRSYARIWCFPKIFQIALNTRPAYVIEVLSKYYNKLNGQEQKKVLIHELLHIPKNFSGALVPHHVNGRRISILTNKMFKEYLKVVK